jgi:hypothetical protein
MVLSCFFRQIELPVFYAANLIIIFAMNHKKVEFYIPRKRNDKINPESLNVNQLLINYINDLEMIIFCISEVPS